MQPRLGIRRAYTRPHKRFKKIRAPAQQPRQSASGLSEINNQPGQPSREGEELQSASVESQQGQMKTCGVEEGGQGGAALGHQTQILDHVHEMKDRNTFMDAEKVEKQIDQEDRKEDICKMNGLGYRPPLECVPDIVITGIGAPKIQAGAQGANDRQQDSEGKSVAPLLNKKAEHSATRTDNQVCN
jgi:hypothetical protein